VQKISTATASIIVLIALYFTLSWGYEALRVLTSPSYGFEDVWRSQFLFGIGRLLDLGPIGLVKLAAFFATLKLAVACICALHLADRARMRRQSNSEILEAGLILIVLISIVSVGPASWAGSTDLMREHTYQLVFAALATGLCIFERSCVERSQAAEPGSQPVVDAAATQAAPRLHV
jgi:hypothetical protein